MAAQWPQERRLIGKKHARIDGPQKATGKARYTLDINRPKMLHGVILRCPHAHAKIKSIDTTDAEKMPGVKGVIVINGAGKELYYAGDEIAAVAADTEEHAEDAARAIAAKIEFELLDFFVDEESAKAAMKRTVGGKGTSNVGKAGQFTKGNVEDAYKAA